MVFCFGTKMELSIKRIIIFTRQMDAMAAFYRDALALKQIANEPDWKEFRPADATSRFIAAVRQSAPDLQKWSSTPTT